MLFKKTFLGLLLSIGFAPELYASNAIPVPEIKENDRLEATKLIENIKIKTSNSGKSEVEEAEELSEKVEGLKEQALQRHGKNVGEVLSSVEKTQNGTNYKKGYY